MPQSILFLKWKILNDFYITNREVVVAMIVLFGVLVYRAHQIGVPISFQLFAVSFAVTCVAYLFLLMLYDARDKAVWPLIFSFYIIIGVVAIYFFWPTHLLWGAIMPEYRQACEEMRAEYSALSYDYRGLLSPSDPRHGQPRSDEHIRKRELRRDLHEECRAFLSLRMVD